MEYVLLVSAAIFKKDKMLIVRRSSNEEFLAGYWTGVGGKLENSDATIEAGVVREVKEETNLGVKPIIPIVIESFTREDRPGKKAINIIYFCRIEGESEPKLSEEHDSYKWISAEELDGISPMTDLARDTFRKLFSNFQLINTE